MEKEWCLTAKDHPRTQHVYEWGWSLRPNSWKELSATKMYEMVENFVFPHDWYSCCKQLYKLQLHRAEHPEQEDLKRPKKYSITEFREELVRQLAGLEEYGQPPVFNPSAKSPGDYETIHIPQFSEVKKNCKVCYATIKQELKVVTYCSAPQCQVCLHLTKRKNSFATWHSKNWNHKKWTLQNSTVCYMNTYRRTHRIFVVLTIFFSETFLSWTVWRASTDSFQIY